MFNFLGFSTFWGIQLLGVQLSGVFNSLGSSTFWGVQLSGVFNSLGFSTFWGVQIARDKCTTINYFDKIFNRLHIIFITLANICALHFVGGIRYYNAFLQWDFQLLFSFYVVCKGKHEDMFSHFAAQFKEALKSHRP